MHQEFNTHQRMSDVDCSELDLRKGEIGLELD